MRRTVLVVLLALGGAAGAMAVVRDQAEPPQSRLAGGPDSLQLGRFLTALAATDPVVCDEIGDSFGNFWWGTGDSNVGSLSDRPAGLRAVRDSLRRPTTDPAALRLLSSHLGDPNTCVRRVAAKTLGQAWPASRAILGAALQSAEPKVREAATLALGTADDSSSRLVVEPLLGDRDGAVAAMAAWALGELEAGHALPALRRALDHPDRKVRQSAIWAMGRIEDTTAVTWLLPGLADGDPVTRVLTAEALGSLEDPRAGAALSRAAADPSALVRRAAVHALASLHGLEQVPEGLVSALGSDDVELRRVAVHALAEFEQAEVEGLLLRALKDPDAEVRQAAAEALGDRHHR